MRVLLIHPKFPYRGRDAFPLGLGYLAAVIKEKAEVTVIDENYNSLNLKGMAAHPPDIVGITATTPSFPRATEIAAEIKRLMSDTVTILGGTHATFCPDEALKRGADVVVRGEGEATFKEIIEGKPLEDIRGVSRNAGGKITHNPERGLIEDLDSLPFPAWEFFPLKEYGIISVVTSRGCPYDCLYCCAARFWRGRVRFRSPENVVEELREISCRGYTKVRFMDSTFTLSKDHALEICKLIVEESLDFSWSCETRADSLDEDILKALSRSGCNLLCLGLDSGSQHVLNETRRRMQVDTIKKAFRKIKEHGISTRAYVTFGFPGDSEKGVKETIRLLREIQPDQILLSLATAYPGTELWNMEHREVYLHPSWISKFHGHGVGGRLYLPRELTKKDYVKLADHLWEEVKKLNKNRETLKFKSPQ
jgi:anaerobic magnesium-protoporphyrin IX monomethyl ester cyclase